MNPRAASRAARAVVFAYHDVGVRCLRTVLARGIEVPLVLTHADAPGECIWFESVAQHALWHGIEVCTPDDPNAPAIVERIRAARPDFLFSFYYRSMLGPQLLALPTRGAYNMHGSLLPKYRGRVPVNWAVLHGETQTGATPHAGGNEVPGSELGDEQTTTPPLRGADASLDGEHRQALEQWLRQIPDNPGELLRRKFWYEQQQHQDKTR